MLWEEQFLHSSKFPLFSFIVLKTAATAFPEMKKAGLKDKKLANCCITKLIGKSVLHYTVFFPQKASYLKSSHFESVLILISVFHLLVKWSTSANFS